MAAPSTSDPGGPQSHPLEKLVGGPVAAALYNRRWEFLRRDKCTIKVTTWNVAGAEGTHEDIGTILRDSSLPETEIRQSQSGNGAAGGSEIYRTGSKIDCAENTHTKANESPEVAVGTLAEGQARSQQEPDIRGHQNDRERQAGYETTEAIDHGNEVPTKTEIRETSDERWQPDHTEPGKQVFAEDKIAENEVGRTGIVTKLNCIQVICLQEVVDVTSPENFIRSVDEVVQKRWQDAIQAALPEYRCLIVQQMVGILMFIYVSPDIASQITTPSSTTVGTGLLGYMGNKGGALGRLVIGGLPAAGISPPSFLNNSLEDKDKDKDKDLEHERGATIVFVNCHLAAFTNAVERRNWDYAEISRRAYFHPKSLPISGGGSAPESIAAAHPNGYPFSECDLVIWAGDLNYRLDMAGDDVRRPLHRFLPPEVDGSDPPLKLTGDKQSQEGKEDNRQDINHEAYRNFQETIENLLRSDQLRKQQSDGKAFQYFHEGAITFLPTYKYDIGKISTFDSSEKARVPSYCDRILWKDWAVEKEEIERVKARTLADARDKLRESHLDENETSDILFDFGQEEEDAAGDESEVRTYESYLSAPPKEMEHDITSINEIDITDIPSALKLHKYISNQTIRSSDHKPVMAEFSLSYLAVDQEKRSLIQVEVVKELDRHENEARPAVTVIVDSDANSEIVDFGELTWDQVVRRTVTIANTGRTAATCEFVKRPVLPTIMESDEDSDNFSKISADDIYDPMAFGEESSVGNGAKEEVCKAWLSATFSSSQTDGPRTLQPGEAESVTLRISLPPRKYGRQSRSSHARLLRRLNKGKEELSDVLVMRVSKGQDKFIPVKAEYKPTFLGYGLTELLRVPDSAGGVRNNPKCDGEAHWSAPRELFRMTEYLLLSLKSIVMSEGGDGVRWTMLPGWPFVKDTWGLADSNEDDDEGADELVRDSPQARSALKRWIRDALDCDTDWSWDEVNQKGYSEEDKCETMAECLLDWLGYLKQGVLPAALYGEVVKGVGGKAWADKILDTLPAVAPSVHANVFIYLTGFIAEVISLLSPKQDAAVAKNPLSPSALVKRLSASSKFTTTDLVKKSVLKEFSEVIVKRPAAMDGWRSETLERREEERRAAFLAAFVG
ncbi:Synaptojanin-1 [Dactylellina cionopaga]|nr:Synaptojanin-1 [Dactylellina cionopaga]